MGSKPLKMGLTMAQRTNDAPLNDIIKLNFLLLDKCSTISSIKNKYLFEDIYIYDVSKELQAYKKRGTPGLKLHYQNGNASF